MSILKELEFYQKQFSLLKGLELTPRVRGMLFNLIKEMQEKGGFHRKDEKKVVNLYNCQEAILYGMAPDISIGIGDDNRIWVNDDGIWGTMTGFYEQELEEKQEQISLMTKFGD